MEQANKYTEASWGVALRIWWWVTWHSVLTSLGCGFILGVIVGFAFAFIGINSATTQIISFFLGMIMGVVLNIFFMKKVIGKKFKNLSLVLIKEE